MRCKKRKNSSETSSKKIVFLLILGFVLVIIPVISLLVDSNYLFILYMTRISKGSQFYDILAKENEATYLKVYIFNVTNADAFLSGEEHKIRIEEVGPFTYQEFRTNENFEVDEEAGVMRYKPTTRTEFRPDMSISEPSLVNVTVPNSALLAMASMLSSYPFWTKSAFVLLANRLHSVPFVSTDAETFLWSYDEPLISLANTILPGWISFSKMGVMDRLYDNASIPLLEVSTSSKDKFSVKTADGVSGFKMWDYENPSKRTRCNTLIDAYEGYAYKPKLTREDPVRLYRHSFCRTIDLRYTGTTKTDISPEAFVYQLNNRSYSRDPSTECLCGRDNECIDGISDASPCYYGLSLALSNGHFLHADPNVYERLEGIHPDEKKHGSEFVIDPKIGAVISGRFTLQVNIAVKDLSYYPKLNAFSNMVVPLLYFKIVQPELNQEAQVIIRKLYTLYPYLIHGVEVLLFLVGLITFTYAARKIYWNWICYEETEPKNKFLEETLIEDNNKVIIIEKSDLDIYSLDD